MTQGDDTGVASGVTPWSKQESNDATGGRAALAAGQSIQFSPEKALLFS